MVPYFCLHFKSSFNSLDALVVTTAMIVDHHPVVHQWLLQD